jgi:hypothetical protein
MAHFVLPARSRSTCFMTPRACSCHLHPACCLAHMPNHQADASVSHHHVPVPAPAPAWPQAPTTAPPSSARWTAPSSAPLARARWCTCRTGCAAPAGDRGRGGGAAAAWPLRQLAVGERCRVCVAPSARPLPHGHVNSFMHTPLVKRWITAKPCSPHTLCLHLPTHTHLQAAAPLAALHGRRAGGRVGGALAVPPLLPVWQRRPGALDARGGTGRLGG